MLKPLLVRSSSLAAKYPKWWRSKVWFWCLSVLFLSHWSSFSLFSLFPFPNISTLSFQQPLLENDLINLFPLHCTCQIKYSVSKEYLHIQDGGRTPWLRNFRSWSWERQHLFWEGTPFGWLWKDFVYEIAYWKAWSGQKCQNVKYFKGEKHHSTISNARIRLLCSFLRILKAPCLFLECFSIQVSEERIIIIKPQTIILTQGYKYNLISQVDHRERFQMFTLWLLSNLYFLEVRASPTVTPMSSGVFPTKSNNNMDVLLILQSSKSDVLRYIS